MDGHTVEYFGEAAKKVDAAVMSVGTYVGNLTLQMIAIRVVAVVALILLIVFICRHKRIMSEVRASLLTISGIVSGAIHAIVAVGIYKAFW